MARVRWSDPSMTTIYARPNPHDAMRSLWCPQRLLLACLADSDHVAIGLPALGPGLDLLFATASNPA